MQKNKNNNTVVVQGKAKGHPGFTLANFAHAVAKLGQSLQATANSATRAKVLHPASGKLLVGFAQPSKKTLLVSSPLFAPLVGKCIGTSQVVVQRQGYFIAAFSGATTPTQIANHVKPILAKPIGGGVNHNWLAKHG